jgi:hypothetical protein
MLCIWDRNNRSVGVRGIADLADSETYRGLSDRNSAPPLGMSPASFHESRDPEGTVVKGSDSGESRKGEVHIERSGDARSNGGAGKSSDAVSDGEAGMGAWEARRHGK